MKARLIAPLPWVLLGLGLPRTAVTLVLGLSRPSGGGLTSFPNELIWFLSLALFVPVGALIARRQPRNPVGWLIVAIGLSEVLSKFAYEYAARSLILSPGSLPGGGAMAWLSSSIWAPQLGLFPFMILLFPNGRSLSRRWSWVGWLSVSWLAVFMGFAIALWPYRGAEFLRAEESFGVQELAAVENIVFSLFPLVTLSLAAALVSLIVRFRRSRGEERQQLKWIALVAALGAVGIVASDVVLEALNVQSPVFQLLSETIGGPGTFAVATGIAMLRYRLYAIDRIINRTLVYAAVTGVLILVYVGGVFGVGGLIRNVSSGENNNLVVAASTLAVAAVFRPARGRIQNFIDRRFYRRKYDAAQTLQDFSARLRDEVDLDASTASLLAVIRETMQPEHASLWLKQVPYPFSAGKRSKNER
ncbi:MAG: hypothetical protein H0V97_04995 [Actinobacteria bacterium]|nr:hypothetical protein [Actinomycetota bacterium]